MDFEINGLVLDFLQNEPILNNFLIFYFDKSWDKFNKKVIISDSKIKNYEVALEKNYINIPKDFLNSESLMICVVGNNGIEEIRTNKKVGRRIL